jgi:mannose-1-phosphate guanylyltransferase
MMGALETHLPRLHEQLMDMKSPRSAKEIARTYPDIESISIDYGVLEHAESKLVVEADFEWDDLGTFEAVARQVPRRPDGNRARGDALFLGARHSLVENDAPGMVVVSGLDGILVVRTGDTVLVMPRSEAEGVKDIVRQLEESGHEDLL